VADFTVKRVVLVAALAGAVVGGAVASGVAAASSGPSPTNNSSPAASTGSVATTAVVRANLQSTVQVGGSIGYRGSYLVAAPTGSTAQQVAQAQQQVTQARQALTNDQTMNSYSAAQDAQGLTGAQNAANAAAATLATDQARAAQQCAGPGASTPACSQDTQKVSQDVQQVNQTQQQLGTAQLNTARDQTQARAKIQSDTDQLQVAESNLASTEANEVNPGTTYTSLPKVGDIIRQDGPVYSVNGTPVPLLYGATAAYRAFFVGMSDGSDVGQLTHDLIGLGYGAGLTESNHYSSATAAAVERWQTALGLPSTGTVLLGQVVFEPGPIRVTTVTPSVGQTVAPGAIVDATSTTPLVTVALQVTQEYLLKPGDAVSVVLPDGSTTVGGHVQTVGNVATCPGGSGSGTGNGGSADQSPCSSSGSGNSSTPTVTITIALDRTPPGATLDQAPVNVNITTDRADDVLAVPVNALLALEGGGSAVEVVTGTTHRLVGVTTGLYSNTMVQISGSGISAGTLVEVPSS
jgi:multidrug efflux pump subunit AcrA (membrane-fusion protein)